MKHAWFLTGTDTEIGKTFVACTLLHAARRAGFSAVGMKPVAAGVEADGANDDVRRLLEAGSLPLAPDDINPYLLAPPIAPHIAAEEAGLVIDFDVIGNRFRALAGQADVVVVEGAGGFRVPFGPAQDSADLAVALGLPVILTVGMRLGCINHALLTAESVLARGLTLAGWVANRIDPAMARFEQNLEALRTRLPAPLLGVVPHAPAGGPAGAAAAVELPL